jgi:hypothetical protein
MNRFVQESGGPGAHPGRTSALADWRVLLSVSLMVLACPAVRGDSSSSDLTHLSVEDLMNLEVVSTAKQAQRVADAAAAVFVITQDDIRRSGATHHQHHHQALGRYPGRAGHAHRRNSGGSSPKDLTPKCPESRWLSGLPGIFAHHDVPM